GVHGIECVPAHRHVAARRLGRRPARRCRAPRRRGVRGRDERHRRCGRDGRDGRDGDGSIVSNAPNRKRRPPSAPSPPANRGVVWTVLGVIALVAVIAVVVVAASGGGNDGATEKRPAKFQTAPQLTIGGTSLPRFDSGTRDAAVGVAAPTLDSVDFAGKAVQAGGATGTPYALVFLAHWCPHCQAEGPRLVALAKGGRIAGV